MSRHHNRAILSEITKKQLDPNKKYIAGKHGLTLSLSEKNKVIKIDEQDLVQVKSEQSPNEQELNSSFQELKEDTSSNIIETFQESDVLPLSIVDDIVDDSKLDSVEKNDKKKKVNKSKV